MENVNKITEKIDIVELIKRYVPVKKIGRSFTANCPFHDEKTPSLIISPERKIWYCFGCDKGGDAIKFYMKIENVKFHKALKELAYIAGVQLTTEDKYDLVMENLAKEARSYIKKKHPNKTKDEVETCISLFLKYKQEQE